MSLTRSELRENAVLIMYQIYILEQANIKYDIKDLVKEQSGFDNEFAKSLIEGVLENRDTITNLANKYLIDWEIDRLGKVDKAILSVGIYELMYTDVPSIVAINEAIELRFGIFVILVWKAIGFPIWLTPSIILIIPT